MKSTLVLAALAASVTLPAAAQTGDYPNRPVRIIVPQTAGGAVDIVARAIAQKLSEAWGQQVIIDNRPGANGIIGIEAVAKSKPDGYTLAAPFTSVLTINPFVYKKLPYDAFKDFAPVMQSVVNVIVLVVHPSLPVRSVKELVALGKSRPGDIVYGSFGVGNLTHLAGELLRMETGMKMVHVPYKGESPAVTDLIGGNTCCCSRLQRALRRISMRAGCACSLPAAKSARPPIPTRRRWRKPVPGRGRRGLVRACDARRHAALKSCRNFRVKPRATFARLRWWNASPRSAPSRSAARPKNSRPSSSRRPTNGRA
jgi:tripartite-type tricarboxylate transporter receptor subunit TctC